MQHFVPNDHSAAAVETYAPADICSTSAVRDAAASFTQKQRRHLQQQEQERCKPDKLNVFLFIPNIIGYVRVLLLMAATVFVSFKMTLPFLFSYITSQLLDGVDGEAARRFGQTSIFGASFDQVTDRISTCLLYFLNAVAYPSYAPVFFGILLLDIGGHWFMVFSAAQKGVRSHKTVEETANKLLKIYYRSRVVMCTAVVGQEAFFLALLLRKQIDAAAAVHAPFLYYALLTVLIGSGPLMLFKVLTNVLQGQLGAQRLAALQFANND